MRLIDADALMRCIPAEEIASRMAVANAPTIEERKTGMWIDYTDEGYVECPFCHSATNCDGNKDELHYCFSCGARMETESRYYKNKGDDD